MLHQVLDGKPHDHSERQRPRLGTRLHLLR
jgi:hypothetical protein